jgi:sugar lactone lactonase YvrE
MLGSVLRSLAHRHRSALRRKQPEGSSNRQPRCRPRLEALEDRCLFSVTIGDYLYVPDLHQQWTAGESGFRVTLPITGGTAPYGLFGSGHTADGLTWLLTGNTIKITGTPSTAGHFVGGLLVWDARGTQATNHIDLQINPPLTLGTLSATQWTAGEPGFTGGVAIMGGTTAYGGFAIARASGLPAGLTLVVNGATVSFTGTPTVAGTYSNASITIRDSIHATVTRTFSITIHPAPTVSKLPPTQWTVGQSGLHGMLTIGGGTGPFQITNSGGLPTGLMAVLNGRTITFSGTPNVAQTFATGSVTIQDSTGAVVSGTFSITINAAMAIADPTVSDPGPLPVTIKSYHVPTAPGYPSQITAGPDGNLWFVEGRQIAEINPASHATTEYRLPYGDLTSGAITLGPDGNLWFGEADVDTIGDINPVTHAIKEYPLPPLVGFPTSIAAGADGNIWFTESDTNQIGEFDLTTHQFSEYPLPTAQSVPGGIIAGPDGNLWFVEHSANNIASINPATHAITEYAIPTAQCDPGSITAGPDGNLWFTEVKGNTIGEINPTTGTITEYPLPNPLSSPAGITNGSDGKLWFTESNRIGAINPATHAISEYPVPSVNSFPHAIANGPGGTLWFTQLNGKQVGEIWQSHPHYSVTMTISGGTGPYRIATIKGLPRGLKAKISGATIRLTGIPATGGTFHCQITLSDAAGATVTGAFVLTI